MLAMEFREYSQLDATALARLISQGEVKPAELVEAALARMDDVNDRVNAVVYRMDAQALTIAAEHRVGGQFAGVPFLVKNLGGMVAGIPHTMGSRSLQDYIAPHDTELVARYRRSGVIFVGTTNSPELGLMGTTEPEFHGPTRNPWSLKHSAGGSSGGAAAAVAAGIVPVAHGGDGGGSIRIPASACGLFGLKPSRGRMPMGPDASDGWNGFVVPHVISRSVRDSAGLLDASHGSDLGAPYAAPPRDQSYIEATKREPGRLKIAYTTRSLLGEHTHPDCVEACNDAARLVSSLGHSVEEVDLPISKDETRLAYLTVISACAAAEVDKIGVLLGQRPRPDMFEPSTWFLRQVGHALSAADLEQARMVVGGVSRTIARFMSGFDVVMTPTMAYPPTRIGELGLKSYVRAGLAIMRKVSSKFVLKRALIGLAGNLFEKTANTMVFNMTGQPAMSVPLFWNSEGLPIGIQFAGRFGEEGTLLQLAAQLEQVRPWAHRRPLL
jgi:amidase